MRKLYVLFLGVVLSLTAYGQQSLDIGFAAGTTNYFGDLGNEEFFQKSSMSPGIAITVRNFISPSEVSGMKYSPINIEARLSWHRIQYDETNAVAGKSGSELRNYGRGLGFRNDLMGFSSHLSYTYYPNRRLPLYKQSMAFLHILELVSTTVGLKQICSRAMLISIIDIFSGVMVQFAIKPNRLDKEILSKRMVTMKLI
ncbi:MAG: hypothetical protein IPJ26_19765 [Bacteroidetes bacterium]|nr:hypothetical protein [Bacteroidota bacterium]